MRAFFLLIVAMALILSGCGGGGGGGGGSNPPTTVDGATFEVVWPARTRAGIDHDLTSAQSLSVRLIKADAQGADIIVQVDRDAARDEAYTSTHRIAEPVLVSFNALTATFYAEPSGGGAIVGTASASVNVANGKLNLASLVINGKVKAVDVVSTGPLVVGTGVQQLLANTKDAANSTVAVSPGSIKWTVLSGGSNLTVTPDGIATPVAEGTATVTATVDGITSEPASIAVHAAPIAGASFKISWPARTRESLGHGLTSALSAKVRLTATAPDQDKVVNLTVNRDPSQTAAHTETYNIGEPVSPKVAALTATFYSQGSGEGEIVGTATAKVEPKGNVLDFDDIVVEGRIKTIEVLAPSQIDEAGQAVQLLASTEDADGAAVAVTPGSIRWKVTNGSTYLSVTPDGVATGLGGGTATVSATIDGLTSAPLPITVAAKPISEPSFRISWPARTRASIAHGLTSALSAKVVLIDAATNGNDIAVVANRDPERLEAHTVVYPVGQSVAATVSSLTATFYAGSDAAGATVGTATASVEPSGSKLEVANLVVDGRITSVSVVVPARIEVGTKLQLLASAKDASNATVAVSTGSVRWKVTSGSSKLSVTAYGEAQGLALGDADVTATIDGVTSAVQNLKVLGTSPTLQTIRIPVNELVYSKANGKIWATIPANGGANANCVVSIDPATGAIGDRVLVGPEPHQIAITDDGKYAYVSVEADGTVRRVKLLTHNMGPSVSVGSNDFEDLATVPGKPEMFLVARSPIGGVNLNAWKSGVKLDGTGAVGYRIHFASDGKTIYGDGEGALFEDVLSDTKVTWTDEDFLDVTGFKYSEGLIYTSKGLIINPVTKSVVGQLTTPATIYNDRHTAVSDADDRVYIVTWNHGIGKQLLTFDKTKRTAIDAFDTKYTPGGATNMVACDNHTVAFSIYGDVEHVVNIVRGLP